MPATQFRYIPAVGARVTMRLFNDYSSRGIPVWAHLLVLAVSDPDVTVEVLNGTVQTGDVRTVPIAAIAPPIGWQERYTIHVSPDKLQDVLGWLSRGISVRPCRDLSAAGRVTYQPADNNGQPHWAYPEVADIVPPEQTRDRIEVRTFEQDWSAGVPRPCKYCIDGKRTPENNPAMHSWQEHIHRCPRCNLVMGFSFTEPFHDMICKYGGYSSEPVESLADMNERTPCPETHPAGRCSVCQGTGIARKYLSECDTKGGKKSERAQAIAELEKDGWSVHYDRHARCYVAERERTVKAFGQDAPKQEVK